MPINEPETKTSDQREDIKRTVATLFKGGVIAVVCNINQALIAERYGACAVVVVNDHPNLAMTKNQILHSADPRIINTIMSNIMLPVIGRVRFGHIPEAEVMEASGVVAIDENTMQGASSSKCIPYKLFNVPVISEACSLTEALQNICKGAAIIRNKLTNPNSVPTAGTNSYQSPSILDAVTAFNIIQDEIIEKSKSNEEDQQKYAKESNIPISLLKKTISLKRLPVPFFAEGGILYPTDAAMLMDIGYDGIVLSIQIFYGSNAEKRMRAILMSVAHYKDPLTISYIAEESGYAGSAPSGY
ncbi:hypothetical protein COEREDRAFT_45498 [Coemansia reversa NRRL 1564]|uniref:pyridoxal 5'-phosphate synthase (glutamine hydrolyzing) n=1 Tax=Coemansia reversa (strain ATCC 12441 / NRRL 1564) TaxID=763665 RepID=A0A2G5B8N7_COERN|nr:hypothetical protein COEREDRAFT_45498 [Coemansia reversa NRRL 1564]|eukprot:PIA15097.1 hypothetical protein COEREDRAFT_45498 [Coemansia reversa NRRL 1564]